MDKAAKLIVKGRLHDGYRHYARLAAQDYHINGKIESNSEATKITIEAQGNSNDLENFIEFCKKGPAWCRVDSIDIEEIATSQNRTSFEG